MVTTRRKIGNFKSRILVSAEQARNETFLSLSLLSAEAFPCFLIHILVKCAKVLLKRQYRLPRSNGTQGEQIGIDLFVLSNATQRSKATEFFFTNLQLLLPNFTSQKKNNWRFSKIKQLYLKCRLGGRILCGKNVKGRKKESSSNHRQWNPLKIGGPFQRKGTEGWEFSNSVNHRSLDATNEQFTVPFGKPREAEKHRCAVVKFCHPRQPVSSTKCPIAVQGGGGVAQTKSKWASLPSLALKDYPRRNSDIQVLSVYIFRPMRKIKRQLFDSWGSI